MYYVRKVALFGWMSTMCWNELCFWLATCLVFIIICIVNQFRLWFSVLIKQNHDPKVGIKILVIHDY